MEQESASRKAEEESKLRKGTSVLLVTVSWLYQIPDRQKQLKEKRVYTGPKLESIVHRDGEGRAGRSMKHLVTPYP